jgi:APA family basic amino acid/polyamine antiporter
MESEPAAPTAVEGETCDVEVKLKRDLGLLEITMIGLGPTIGSTIFLLVGFGIGIAGPALILAFVLNFIVTIFTAMAYAELGSAFSDTGGGYLWVKDGMPQPFGFLAGWMSWFGHAIVTSFYVLGFGYGVMWLLQAYNLFPELTSMSIVVIPGLTTISLVTVLAVVACVIFIYINYRGTKTTGKSSNYITTILIAIVIIYIIAGLAFMFGKPNLSGAYTPFMPPEGFGNIVIAMGFTFIVFEGYEIIAQCGEECKDPEKNIPRAHWITITLAAVIFILVAVVTIGVIGLYESANPAEVVTLGENTVADVARISMPGFGIQLIGVGIIIGALAAINSTLFSSSRVAFAMGRDRALPVSFGKLHKTKMTPHIAIFVSGAIIISMTVFLPIAKIAAAADIMFLLLMVFVNIAVVTLRYKRPNVRRKYLMPLFPLIPALGLITKGVMAVSLYAYEPEAWFMALAWVVAGLALFYFTGGKTIMETVEPEDVCRKGIIDTLAEKPEDKRYHVLVSVVDDEQKALVEFSALVARVEDADLNIVSVVELPSGTPLNSLGYKGTVPYIKLVEKMKKVGDRELIKSRGTVLISHKASEAIRDTINEDKVNLLVMGWRGTVRDNWILGSTIDRLVHTANCDVVVMKTTGLKKEVKKILLISSPEWHATHAIGYAILIAKRDDAEIEIFSASTTDRHMAVQEEYAKRLSEICKIHSIPHEVKVIKTDSIEGAIIAESQEYDLVVMGASQESERRAFDFGRVQDHLAKRLDKPTLMVKKVREK